MACRPDVCSPLQDAHNQEAVYEKHLLATVNCSLDVHLRGPVQAQDNQLRGMPLKIRDLAQLQGKASNPAQAACLPLLTAMAEAHSQLEHWRLADAACTQVEASFRGCITQLSCQDEQEL